MRVVAKIGTSSLTHGDGSLNAAMFASLADQVSRLREAGHEVLLVSSGAVAAGVAALGMSERPADVGTLQALAAIGQSRLMERYNAVFSPYGVVTGQVLLVPHDFGDRRQYLHARQTMLRLLDLGVVPVINENDAIASDEIRFGDNDRIAALVAHSVGADVLVLLTDQEGLYTKDPRTHADAELVEVVNSDDDLLSISAGRAGTARGSGGMASKLSAARIASWSGIRSVIARASRADALVDAVDPDVRVGTTFLGRNRDLSARKLWIAFAAQAEGRIVVDSGAVAAMVDRGTSLLSPGVTGVEGNFAAGDVVEVVDAEGGVVARGAVALSAGELATIRGRRAADLPEGVSSLAIHRDEMVVLAALG